MFRRLLQAGLVLLWASTALAADTVYRFSPVNQYDIQLTAAVENVLDEDYRHHGSGQNEPGVNAIVGLDWSF